MFYGLSCALVLRDTLNIPWGSKSFQRFHTSHHFSAFLHWLSAPKTFPYAFNTGPNCIYMFTYTVLIRKIKMHKCLFFWKSRVFNKNIKLTFERQHLVNNLESTYCFLSWNSNFILSLTRVQHTVHRQGTQKHSGMGHRPCSRTSQSLRCPWEWETVMN